MYRIISLGLSLFVSETVLAGGIHKCKQADGGIAFSNIACPQNTVSSERVGTHSKRRPDEMAVDNPYSVTRQLQQFEIKQAQEKQARLDKLQKVKTQAAVAKKKKTALTFRQAREKALQDTGYRNYHNLSRFQRERVDAAMSEYGYRPRYGSGYKRQGYVAPETTKARDGGAQHSRVAE